MSQNNRNMTTLEGRTIELEVTEESRITNSVNRLETTDRGVIA